MRRSSGPATLALLLVTIRPAVADVPELPIQPGAVIFSPFAQCTMNFVFTDARDRLYIGTAGHCAALGNRVSALGGDGAFEFGTVVYHERTTQDDYALILIDPAAYDLVSPAMRVWGGPTGITTATETAIGDRVMLHGFGIVFGDSPTTRPRQGLLRNDNFTRYIAVLPAIFGDSGGPMLHGPTGKALGTANELSGTVAGPTFEGILKRIASEGLHLEIVTAPLAPQL